MSKKKIAYSYIRFSRAEQAKGHSKKRQAEAAELWCAENGYTLDNKIKMTDSGLSGYSGEHLVRGKLGAFINLAKEGKIQPGSVLIVESLDRLSRLEVPTALRLLLEILDYQIEVVTLLEPVEWFKRETLSEIQLIIAIVVLSRAYNESASKSKRLKKKWIDKRQELRDLGKPMTSLTPSWIMKVGDKYELHPEKASIVKGIVKSYINGIGTSGIARQLNMKNVPTLGRGKQKGEFWSKSTILKLLRNRELIGEFQPHLGRKNQDQSARIPDGEPIPNHFPSLISDADFFRVQKILMTKRRPGRTGNGAGSVSNLFSHMLFDARDGSRMNMVDKGSRSGGKQIVSSAGKYGAGEYISFNYEAFEKTMLSLMQGITIEEIRPVRNNNADLTDSLEDLIGSLGHVESNLRAIQNNVDGKNKNFAASVMPVIAELSRQKGELEEKIAAIQSELHSTLPTPEECSSLVQLMQIESEDLDSHRRLFQRVLREIVERVDVLVLKDGHWRQCFARVAFQNGRVRVVVANVHRKRLVSSGGFDGDYAITTTECQNYLQKRLGSLKDRSIAKTESNLESQLFGAAALRPGVVSLNDQSISLTSWQDQQ